MSHLTLAVSLAFVLTPIAPCLADDLNEALQAKTSLVVGRDSFSEVLKALEAQVQKDHPKLAFKTLGEDLMFEGITRNQVIRDFQHKDRSLAEILTALAVQANPVTKLKSPADPQQKLVWVIAADPDDPKRQVVLFTTRAAAQKRGDKLPAVFEKASPQGETK